MKNLILVLLLVVLYGCVASQPTIKRDANGKPISKFGTCLEPKSVFTRYDGSYYSICGGSNRRGLESSADPETRAAAQAFLRERERERERANPARAHSEKIRAANNGKLICEGATKKDDKTHSFYFADSIIKVCRFPQPGEREYFEVYKELHKNDPNHWLRYYDED